MSDDDLTMYKSTWPQLDLANCRDATYLYGLSPVCFLMCFLRALGSTQAYSQFASGHLMWSTPE